MNPMKTILPLALTAALLLLAACDSMDTGAADDLVVVEAYLYADEPVDDIRLTTVVSIDSEDSLAAPINDADVRLVKDGVTYALTSSGTDGTYFYGGDDLVVATDDVFRLDIDRGSTHITAETTVPAVLAGGTEIEGARDVLTRVLAGLDPIATGGRDSSDVSAAVITRVTPPRINPQ